MAIHYRCRHCNVNMGTLESESVDTSKLGLHLLTDEDRAEMINYSEDGHVYITSICEDCHESLTKNPNFYENEYLIH